MEKGNELKVSSGVASLVLGIISTLTVMFWYVTIPTSILAIVLGVKSIKRAGSKTGKAGMILGIVGLSLFMLIYISFILIIILSEM